MGLGEDTGGLTGQREAEEQGKAKGTFSLTFTVLTFNSGFYIQLGSCTLSHTMYQTSLMAQTKESACNEGDQGPGSESSPGEGHGNSLQNSCLENSMDRRAWQAIAHGITKSQTLLSD